MYLSRDLSTKTALIHHPYQIQWGYLCYKEYTSRCLHLCETKLFIFVTLIMKTLHLLNPSSPTRIEWDGHWMGFVLSPLGLKLPLLSGGSQGCSTMLDCQSNIQNFGRGSPRVVIYMLRRSIGLPGLNEGTQVGTWN